MVAAIVISLSHVKALRVESETHAPGEVSVLYWKIALQTRKTFSYYFVLESALFYTVD